jgi:tetratricopeptide (TPR) repeat protein
MGKPRRKASAIRVTLPADWIVAVVWLGILSRPAVPRPQSDVQRLYQEAQGARARGDLETAERNYLEVIHRAPQMANAYHNLGIVYFMERKYLDAAAALEDATKLKPGLAEAYAMLGLTYYELYEPERALSAFRSALRLNPRDSNALLYLGKSQLQQRDYRSAAKTFENLAASRPGDPDVLYGLSLAHMKLMLDAVNRLGEVAPHSYQFFLLLAQDAETRGDDEAALKNLKEAVRVKSDAIGVHYALGSVVARLGKYDEAEGEFRRELKVNANDPLALWKLGELLLRTNPPEAREILERGVRLNPELPQLVLVYGRALARTGDTEKAITQFRRVVQLAPEEDSVHYHLAAAYRLLGRSEESKAELARFQELAQKKSERGRETARQLIELSREAQAAGDELEPSFSPTREPAHH